jgi:AcrR family transcriptional regulator
MSGQTVRERVVDAAFDLFDDRGFEQTTVDDIVERAGVGRTTFFRLYRSKDEVIFPDHAALLRAVEERLSSSNESTALLAVTEAVRLVLMRYVDEGERARRRYLLTSRVPALRAREMTSVALYQRLFRGFIAELMAPEPDAALRAELMAAAVVSAHNHVLRRWLRNEATDPISEIDSAMAQVVALFAPALDAPAANSGDSPDHSSNGTTVIVLHTSRPTADILPAVRVALGIPDTGRTSPASGSLQMTNVDLTGLASSTG